MVEFYFQPNDPYSYLLAQLMPELEDVYKIKVKTHVVVTPSPDANSEQAMRLLYAISDCEELARYYNVTFPSSAIPPTKQDTDRAAAAVLAGASAIEVGAALWSGRAGDLPAQREQDARLIARSESRLRRKGHYMGGMLRVGNLWCWGIDRLHYAERALGGEPLLLRKRSKHEWPPAIAAASLEYYVSFRSPYAYLSARATLSLPIDISIRPVLPMVTRGHKVPRSKRMYIVKDCKREADRLGVPFGRICDPLGLGVERCHAVFEYAKKEQKASAFFLSAMQGIWAEAADVSRDTDMKRIVHRAGLDWRDAQEAIEVVPWRSRAEQNRQALYSGGLWGVPSYRLGPFVTWGQDRLWMVDARIAR